jgi:hypothetical protein
MKRLLPANLLFTVPTFNPTLSGKTLLRLKTVFIADA